MIYWPRFSHGGKMGHYCDLQLSEFLFILQEMNQN